MRSIAWGPFIALLALIAVAAVGQWRSVQPAQMQHLRGEVKQEVAQGLSKVEHAENSEVFGVKRGEWLLFLATVGLWFATWQLVRGAEKTAERQLRAYIGTFEMSLRVYPFEGGGFTYITHIEIRNFGQTPAYEMMLWADTTIDVPSALPFSDTPATPVVSGEIAFPSAGLHVRRFKNISEAEVEEIRNRTKTVFFWGIINYKDAFGSPRHFKFRLINTEQQLGQGGAYGMGPHEYRAN